MPDFFSKITHNLPNGKVCQFSVKLYFCSSSSFLWGGGGGLQVSKCDAVNRIYFCCMKIETVIVALKTINGVLVPCVLK